MKIQLRNGKVSKDKDTLLTVIPQSGHPVYRLTQSGVVVYIRNIFPRVWHLNDSSPVGGNIWGGLASVVLVEEVYHGDGI